MRPADPLVLIGEVERCLTVIACDAAAEQLGISPGMALTDARAVAPGLSARPLDAAASLKDLRALAAWCRRFTPWTAVDGDDGLWLDITGCDHLFGGEAAMRGDVLRRLRAAGYRARGAIADCPAAAWAMARCGDSAIVPPGSDLQRTLAPLSLAALRLPQEVIESLARLGLRTIGQLQALPRSDIARRFPKEVLNRLDQALGRQAEALLPLQVETAWRRQLVFADPIATREDIARATQALLQELCGELSEAGEGARRLELTFYRVDGVSQYLRIGTSRPNNKPELLFRLFDEHLERIAPGFGIDMAELLVLVKERLSPEQQTLQPDAMAKADDCGPLVDKLVNRLGPQRILGLQLKESHVPEFASRPTRRALQGGRAVAARARPLQLLSRPHPIDIMKNAASEPAQFSWQHRSFQIGSLEGPERIEAEWWRANAPARDYYRASDRQGRRFWLYRQQDRDGREAWFLHGLFG